ESANIIERVSVIDEKLSGGTHGNEMAGFILSQNPDAKIVSIRALNDQGEGTVSSIVSAMEYAMNANVDIINLSMYARKNLATSVLEAELQKAIDMGIVVVGAAGNAGKDVSGFVPGSVKDVYAIGSVNNDGRRNERSNYGELVDYYVASETTSEAAAKFSGYVSKNGLEKAKYDISGLIYQKADNIPEEMEKEFQEMHIADTLQIVAGTEFCADKNLENIDVPENASVKLSFSNVNEEVPGLYATLYHVKEPDKAYSVKRPVEVVEDMGAIGKHKVEFVSTMPDGLSYDLDTTHYQAGETVNFSVTPQDGVKIDNIKVFHVFDGVKEERIVDGETLDNVIEFSGFPDGNIRKFGDNVLMLMETRPMPEESTELSYVNENTQYCSFEMPDSPVQILVEAEYDTAMYAASDSELNTFVAWCSHGGFYYFNRNVMALQSAEQAGTTHRTAKYSYKDSNGRIQKREVPLYCVEPSRSNPLPHGSSTTFHASDGNVLPIKGNSLMAKGLYYLYGGPAWGKTIELSDDSKVNFKSL
ncbi:protein containing Peptidase S8 and S53, subtilisin, kexin, sedolisin domain protein, partial [gut metagenome]